MAQAYVYEDDSAGWRHIQSGDVPSGAGSPLTTKGDLYGFDTANNRIPVGANNTVLTADSTQALGVKWAAAGSGITTLTSTGGTITVTTPTGPTTNVDLPTSGVTAGTYGDSTHVSQVHVNADGIVTSASSVAISGVPGSGMVLIYDNTLGGAAGSIDTGANGVSGGHKDLIVFLLIRSANASNTDNVIMRFNNDSGANYDWSVGRNQTTTYAGASATAATSATISQAPGSTAQANSAAAIQLTIPAYDATTFFKQGTSATGPSNTTTVQGWFGAFQWENTGAITRIAVGLASGGNFVAGSMMRVYGTQ